MTRLLKLLLGNLFWTQNILDYFYVAVTANTFSCAFAHWHNAPWPRIHWYYSHSLVICIYFHKMKNYVKFFMKCPCFPFFFLYFPISVTVLAHDINRTNLILFAVWKKKKENNPKENNNNNQLNPFDITFPIRNDFFSLFFLPSWWMWSVHVHRCLYVGNLSNGTHKCNKKIYFNFDKNKFEHRKQADAKMATNHHWTRNSIQ